MDMEIEIIGDRYGYDSGIVDVDGPDGVWQHKLQRAKLFFDSAAGYIDCETFDKWFKEG